MIFLHADSTLFYICMLDSDFLQSFKKNLWIEFHTQSNFYTTVYYNLRTTDLEFLFFLEYNDFDPYKHQVFSRRSVLYWVTNIGRSS